MNFQIRKSNTHPICKTFITKKNACQGLYLLYCFLCSHFYLDNVKRYPYEQEATILSVDPEDKKGLSGNDDAFQYIGDFALKSLGICIGATTLSAVAAQNDNQSLIRTTVVTNHRHKGNPREALLDLLRGLSVGRPLLANRSDRS